MEKKRKQTSLDAFITRTRVVTSSDGTVRSERIITEDIIFQKIDEDMLQLSAQKKFPCGIRGCGNFFGNKGALQMHTLIKHQGQRPVGQSFVLAGICW